MRSSDSGAPAVREHRTAEAHSERERPRSCSAGYGSHLAEIDINMRLEKLSKDDERKWRETFRDENWILGSMLLGITPPEFGEGETRLESMHFGYYLQPLHLSVADREDLPRKLLWALAHRKPPLDFLELMGAGIRIPHAFPQGFTLGSVLRITLQELQKIPLAG